MLGRSPQRCSCRTAPRINAWVESVSAAYAPLSTSSTRAPARASNRAVAAPAQRAPTMTASTLMRHASLRETEMSHRLGDLLRDHPGVGPDTVDETRVPAALKIQAEHVQSGFRGDP